MKDTKSNILDAYRELFENYLISEHILRCIVLKELRSKGFGDSYIDKTRRMLEVAGFLKTVKFGTYELVKQIPSDYNVSKLNKDYETFLYPDSTKN